MENQINSVKENNSQNDREVNKYPALRIVIGIMKIIAWLAVIFIPFAIYALFTDNTRFFNTNILILLGAVTTALTFFAIAETIEVLIDIEYNTRIK